MAVDKVERMRGCWRMVEDEAPVAPRNRTHDLGHGGIKVGRSGASSTDGDAVLFLVISGQAQEVSVDDYGTVRRRRYAGSSNVRTRGG